MNLTLNEDTRDDWLALVRKHRKKLKGLPRVGFNPNAGNVEHNIAMFNKMHSGEPISVNPISGPFGGDVSAPVGGGMSMGEALERKAYQRTHDKISPELALYIHEQGPYIDANNFDAVYEMLSSDVGTADQLTDIFLTADINPLPYFERYIPSHYASGLNITEVEIPSNIVQILPYAFYACSLLSKVDIEQGVEYIGEEAFFDCFNLVDVNLPNSILSLERACFAECWQLRDVYYHGTKEQFSKVRLNNINQGSDFKTIHCLDGDVYL